MINNANLHEERSDFVALRIAKNGDRQAFCKCRILFYVKTHSVMARTAEVFQNKFQDQSTEGISANRFDALSFVKGSNKRLDLMCVQTIEPSKSFAFSLLNCILLDFN